MKNSLRSFIPFSMKGLFLLLCALFFNRAYGQKTTLQSEKGLTQPKLPTDNRLISKTDSVVQIAAQAFMAAPQTVGLSIGVYHEGKMYTYHYGEVAKGSGKLPRSESLYAIASVTKTFTATLLAGAVVEKRLELNDDIRNYLEGEYPNLEYSGQPIRLVHLINHGSGLPFLLPNIPEIFTDTTLSMTDIAKKIDRPIDRQAFYQALREVKLDTLPGTKFMYSNAGVQLLGFILEKVYQMPYEKLLQSKILKPLHMADTKIVLGPKEKSRLVKAYDEKGNIIPANTSTFEAAGGLTSTIDDMLKYVRWQVKEQEEALRLAHSPTWGDFNPYAVGLNWRMLKKDNKRLLWQDGNMVGYSSLCVLHPDQDLGLVVLTNQMDRLSAGRIKQLVREIATLIEPRVISLP